MASITFSIRAPREILKDKGMAAYGAVQRYIDQAVLNYCEPLVPKRSGNLIASGRRGTKPGSGLVCYQAPYARYQYYGVSSKGKPLSYHGGGKRGSYWFSRMRAVYLQKILATAAKIAGGYPSLASKTTSKRKAKKNVTTSHAVPPRVVRARINLAPNPLKPWR